MSDSSILFTFDEARSVVHANVRMPRRASFSMLDTWMECPGRWAANRLLPKKVEWGSPLIVGGICHAAIQLAVLQPDEPHPQWERLCRQGVEMLQQERDRRGWGDDPAPPVPLPTGDVATADDWARLAAVKLDGFSPMEALDGGRLRPVGTEIHVEGVVDGVPLTGSVDYADRSGVIVDWKTGKVPDRASGRRRHADQLRIYRILLDRMARGCRFDRARDVYVEHHRRVDADLSDEAMEDTVTRMRDAWRGILHATGAHGSGEYELKPSGLCGWCPLAYACPVATLTGAKAREAAKGSIRRDDPRVRYAGTHGMFRTPRQGREENVNDMTSLLDMLDSSDATTDTPSPSQGHNSWLTDHGQRTYPDPWSTDEGREALDRWGLGSEPVTDPWADTPEQAKQPDPWAVDDESTTDEDSTPKETTPETESAPQTPTPAPESNAGNTEAPAATSPATPPLPADRLYGGRAYEGTLHDGRVNTAGYGFSLLDSTAISALRLAGTTGDVDEALGLLLREQWRIGRRVWGDAVPDIHGMEELHPSDGRLFTWLDSALCRDADRALRTALDLTDATMTVVERVETAGRLASNALLAGMSLASHSISTIMG